MSPAAAAEGTGTLADLVLLVLGAALLGNTVAGHLADRVVNFATSQKAPPKAQPAGKPLPVKTGGKVPTAGNLIHPTVTGAS